MSNLPKEAGGDWAEKTSERVQNTESGREDKLKARNMAEVFHPSPVDVKALQEEGVSSSCLSVKSDSPMVIPPSFTHGQDTQENWRERAQSRPDSPSYMSMKTERSMEPPHNFNTEPSRNLRDKKSSTQMPFGGARPKTASALRRENSEFPPMVEDWTKEHVQEWLVKKVKVSAEVAKKLYDQDVSGASLVCFEKKDFTDVGVTLGPAVQIIKHVNEEKMKSSVFPEEDSVGLTAASHHEELNKSSRSMTEWDVSAQRDELSVSDVFSSASEIPSLSSSLALLEELRHKIQNIAVSGSSKSTTGCQETFESSVKNINSTYLDDKKRTCLPRPFDKRDLSFTYAQNYLLPSEVGPSNLIDPVHEYQILPGTEEVSEREILFEFSKELFCFAASCMNSRTNGTIHFGVKPGRMYGQVIGQKLTTFKNYLEEYELRLKEHFRENAAIARACIRPPQFFQVQYPDGTTSDRWIIEVDVIPTHSETQEKVFYTCLHTDSGQQQCQNECLFVRKGSKSINVLAEQDLKTPQERRKSITEDVKRLASARKSAEEREKPQASQKHQGQKLKQLITHGRESLENSLQVIFVTDKCHASQLDHLHFLKEITLFAVLEFDPESDLNGTCSFYRKDRVANIHYPHMYNTQDNMSTIIGKLNLFQQTSWVFCNGRVNEESEADKPFTHCDWLKKRAGEISDMSSFLCNPDILSKDRLLVIFMLHSQVTDISSPIVETFCAIYRKLEGEENIACLCKDAAVFKQWKDVIETRCRVDITNKCIYDLTLDEIDCTIRKLKEPKTQSSRRYLPSTGSSSVLLTKKDEEMMTALDILSENECENTEIETMESFEAFKTKTEEDFYRGGQVTWWNFYLSERPGCLPFIKRDIYDDLYDLITPTQSYTSPCVMLNLFHPPGCGGTTLAMHVLWDLRRKFRCAVLKNSVAHNSEIAVQVTRLLNCGKSEQSSSTPVLLLVDNWADVVDLKQCILSVAQEGRKRESLMVIILNCERTQFPLESSRNSMIENVSITNKLSSKEQEFFALKLKDLESHHERPETFYAFMIMTNNFSEKYIEDLVCNTLKDLDTGSIEGRLLSFLSLLNTYVHASSMSLSLCEQLVGIRNVRWGKETFEEKMNPYSTLLIRFTVEEHGTYQSVRFLHQMVAKHCLEVLSRTHKLSLGEIATNLLHCDALYKSCMGRDPLVQNIQSMLITRHRKEEGDDKDTLFSPLIGNMQSEEGTGKIKDVLEKATHRFDRSATVPQALARYFYLKEKDFTSALLWAEDAKKKTYNSYIADTLGQVYKSHLKYEIEQADEVTPERFEKCLQLAGKAIKAFKDSQDLAKKDEPMDPFDLHTRRRKKSYNTSGYVGETEVVMMLLNLLKHIPFFNPSEKHKKDKMLQFLKGNLPVNAFHENSTAINDQLITVLSDHERLLVSLKPRLKEIFNFFENYFTYFKPKSIEKETADNRNKRKLSEHFKKYIDMFCSTPVEKLAERDNNPNLSLQQKIEFQRHYLEGKRADSFAGLLQCLNEKNGKEMEFILKKWQCVVDHSVSTSDQIHFILANIVLHSIKPRSTEVKRYEELVAILNDLLQVEGTHSNRTELYYLAMLLMWPRRDDVLHNTPTYKNISTYLTSTKKSFKKRFSPILSARSPIAHFFLGTSGGLKRLICKGKLDDALSRGSHQKTLLKSSSLHQQWQSGSIWQIPEVQKLLLRVKGRTENMDIYVNYDGNVKILVRPVYLGSVRSGCSQERVSFYLGFSMEGPVAYDIKYEDEQ